MEDNERNIRIAKQISSVNEIMSILIDEVKAAIEKDDLDTYKIVLDRVEEFDYNILDNAYYCGGLQEILPLEYNVTLASQFGELNTEAKRRSNIFQQEKYLSEWIEKFGDPRI